MPLATNQPLKVAVLGGSFDPIHLGHLHIANQVLELGAAQEIWFIPSGMHRFKADTILLDFDARKSLIDKSIATEKRFRCLDIDKAGSGDGTTYEIMHKLKAMHPQYSFAFLIGMDNLSQLPTWYNFNWLKENVRFLISARPDYSPDSTIVGQLKDFSYVNCKPLNISSTIIRQRLLNGLSIQGLVPHHLLIEITRLYKDIFRKQNR